MISDQMLTLSRPPRLTLPERKDGLESVLGDAVGPGTTTLVVGGREAPAWLKCAQFLITHDDGDHGMVLVTWDSLDEFRRRLAEFGWPIQALEESGRWRCVDARAAGQDTAEGISDLPELVARAARDVRAQRVAIDTTRAPWDFGADSTLRALQHVSYTTRRIGAALLIAARPDNVMSGPRQAALDADNIVLLRTSEDRGRHYRTLEVVRKGGAPGESGEYPFTVLPGDGFMVIPLRLRQTFTQTRWLREAIEADRLLFFAQPILNLGTNRVSRFELLLRLRGDQDEILSPSAFLEVAEGTDLIGAIDQWVLLKAIDLLRRLSRHSWRPVPQIEVNLSSRAVTDSDLLELAAAEIEKSQIDPSNLILEITETAAVEDFHRAQDFIARLKGIGCRFALDDFGVGFSSFHHLKRLPVDYVKIDGSFIENLAADREDQVIVKGIVDVAHGLGKKTIAEYVTDRQALTLLRRLGVHYAQGYLIGRPRRITETWQPLEDGSEAEHRIAR